MKVTVRIETREQLDSLFLLLDIFGDSDKCLYNYIDDSLAICIEKNYLDGKMFYSYCNNYRVYSECKKVCHCYNGVSCFMMESEVKFDELVLNLEARKFGLL